MERSARHKSTYLAGCRTGKHANRGIDGDQTMTKKSLKQERRITGAAFRCFALRAFTRPMREEECLFEPRLIDELAAFRLDHVLGATLSSVDIAVKIMIVEPRGRAGNLADPLAVW